MNKIFSIILLALAISNPLSVRAMEKVIFRKRLLSKSSLALSVKIKLIGLENCSNLIHRLQMQCFHQVGVL